MQHRIYRKLGGREISKILIFLPISLNVHARSTSSRRRRRPFLIKRQQKKKKRKKKLFSYRWLSLCARHSVRKMILGRFIVSRGQPFFRFFKLAAWLQFERSREWHGGFLDTFSLLDEQHGSISRCRVNRKKELPTLGSSTKERADR